MLGKGLSTLPVIAMSAITNGALTAASLPKRIKILNVGRNDSAKGPIFLTDDDVTAFAASQREVGFARVAIDFEHNTVPGSPEYNRTKEPRDVAAYGAPEIVKGDGLFLDEVEWTPTGKDKALNFACLSPAAKLDENGNLVFLHSVGLCKNGAVYDLSFFSADFERLFMKDNIETFSVGELATALGLKADAKKADVLVAFTALAGVVAALGACKEGKLVLLSAMDERVGGVEKVIKDLKPGGEISVFTTTVEGKQVSLKPEEVITRLVKLENLVTLNAEAAVAEERSELIRMFSAEGKVPMKAVGQPYSADDLGKLEVATLKLLHANTPSTVPMNLRAFGATGDKPKLDPKLKGMARLAAAMERENSN